MKQQAPSLAPGFAIDTYLVLDQIGSSAVYRETHEIAADRLVVIRDISQGQYSRPLRVVAFNTAEGWSRDVTEEISRELVDVAVRGGRRAGLCYRGPAPTDPDSSLRRVQFGPLCAFNIRSHFEHW